jgi:hypothetical protein
MPGRPGSRGANGGILEGPAPGIGGSEGAPPKDGMGDFGPAPGSGGGTGARPDEGGNGGGTWGFGGMLSSGVMGVSP